MYDNLSSGSIKRALEKSISPEGFGVYIYLCSIDHIESIKRKDIERVFSVGKDKLYRILNELKEKDLLEQRMIRAGGRFANQCFVIKAK